MQALVYWLALHCRVIDDIYTLGSKFPLPVARSLALSLMHVIGKGLLDFYFVSAVCNQSTQVKAF